MSAALIQSYIDNALKTIADVPSFENACRMIPPFALVLQQSFRAQGLEPELQNHAGKPFVEIHVNIIDEKWRQEFWWGQSYLEIKVSALVPVFTCKKVMIQLDYSVSDADVNSWQHLAGEGEAAVLTILEPVAAAERYMKLGSEISQEVDTGSLPLSMHYRQWKPTVYAIFFDRITDN